MKRFALLLVLSFSFTTIAQADFLPNKFKMNFTQKMVSTLSKKEKTSSGTLLYRYPRSIRFEVELPATQRLTFVANQTKSWYYVPPFTETEKGEVRIRKAQDFFLVELFDLFQQEGLKDNAHYKVDNSDAQHRKVIFGEAMQKKSKVAQVVLSFKDKSPTPLFSNVQQLKILYVDKKSVDLIVDQLNLDLAVTDEQFIFQVPTNTQMVEQD